MEPNENPGIRFAGVKLRRLNFAVRGDVPKELPAGLSFEIDAQLSEDKTELMLLLDVDVFGAVPKDKRPDIDLNLRLVGKFEKTGEGGMSLEEFAKHNGPAHLVPFARELIANITMRSPLPILNIGPINVIALVERGIAKFAIHQDKKAEQQV